MHQASHSSNMGLDALHSRACVRPHLNVAIFSTGVAPTLVVEGNAVEVGHGGVLAESTLLRKSLGHVSGVPELDFLETDGDKAEVVGALGPGDVENSFFGSFNVKKLLLSLDVVDGHSVVVVQVNTGHISFARRDRNSSNAARSLGQSELGDLFRGRGVPDVNGGALSSLASHNKFAIDTDIKRNDIVSVEFGVVSFAFGSCLDLLSTVEFLSTCFGLHNNTKGGNHIDGLSLVVVPQVLLAVTGAVTIDVLDLPFLIGLRWIAF